MSAAIAFRQAQTADVPAIVHLVESAYRGEASRIGWTTEADFLEGQRVDALGVQADINAPHSIILLAELASIAPASSPPSTSSGTVAGSELGR